MYTDAESDGSSPAARAALKVIAFLVPSLAGFVCAFALLRIVRPFDNGSIRLSWIALAVIAAVGSSLLVSRRLDDLLPRTNLYWAAHDFGAAVEERHRAVLRAGGSRRVLREQRRHPATRRRSEVLLTLLDELDRTRDVGRGHSDRVRAYAILIGLELDLDPSDLDELGWSAMLHDLPRLRVSPRSLLDPAATQGFWAPPVDPTERAVEFFEPITPWLPPSAAIAAFHHGDRWDGTGNASGLGGEEIPLVARITAVANRFDELTRGLNGEDQVSPEQARFVLEVGSGNVFDPTVVAAFLSIGDDELAAIRGLSATAAGAGVLGTNAAAVVTQVVIVTGSIAAAVVASDPMVDEVPPRLAFGPTTSTTEPPASTSTTSVPPTSSTAAPTTSTTVDATTTSSVTPPRTMALTYTVGTGLVDGVVTTVDPDRLEVYVDDAVDQTVELEPGERAVVVVIETTDLDDGAHTVRFDLFEGDELLSSEAVRIVV